MPFSINGTFSIINAFTPNTPILSADVNEDFDDIALGMTDLWSRTVSSTMNLLIFTASDTYVPTSGLLSAQIECIGGGAGGGGVEGNATYAIGAGGGGSGAYSCLMAAPGDIGASKAVTIPAAAAGGVAGFNPGTNGGNVSVGTICIALGGLSGSGASSSGGAGRGGAGGSSAGVGTVTAAGAPGGGGFLSNTGNVSGCSGFGGSSRFGGGGMPITAENGPAGTNGGNYGGGGSGAFRYATAANSPGGDGSKGVVIITEFIGPT